MSNIKKNYFYNIIYQILAIILPLITAPYTARVLGASGTGIYAYTHSLSQYFVIFIMLGLNNYGNRSIAKVRDVDKKKNQVFSEIYFMQLLTGFVVLFLFVVLQLLGVFSESKYLWFQLPLIISAIIDVNWYFFGMEKFKLTVSRNIFIKLFTVICIFLLVKDSRDVIIYISILSLGALLSNLCLFPFLLKEVKFTIPKLKKLIPHYKENLILFIPVIATSIYTIMDKIMIGYFCEIDNVGFYEYAERIKNIPLGLITAFGTVMLPRMSNIFAKKSSETLGKKYIDKSMNFSIWLSVALAFGISGVSSEFIPIFLGSGYKECIRLTSYLCFSIIFIAWANVIRTQYLIPKSKNKVYVISTIVGAIVNIILNLLFIPKLQSFGAVLGTIFAEASVCLYQSICIKKELQIFNYLKKTAYYLFSGIVMYIVIRFVNLLDFGMLLTLLLKIVVGCVIYILLTACFLLDNLKDN